MFVLREPDDWSFENVGVRGKIFPVDCLTTHAGILVVETDTGHDTTIMQQTSDFIYYVLSGAGMFLVGDSEVSCSQGDLVVIPHGKEFTYRGRLRMLLLTVPKWTQEQEVTVR